MQTTLLGLGIALILALVAALAGPLFIDWSAYRAHFEREASRLVAAPVRITGTIDAHILPSPAVTLRGVEISGAGVDDQLKAREISVELALGPLIRGEIRATEVALIGPELSLKLDQSGRLDWGGVALRLDPDALSIEKLTIHDGSAVLADAATASQIALENVSFNGDLRSLKGPIKGDGAFTLQGERHGYRLGTGRVADDGSIRLRLAVDGGSRALTADAEGTVRFEQGAPRFEGLLTLNRLSDVVLIQGRAVASEQWRATAKVKASAASAQFEQIELLYGPEERGTKLAGTAELKLGKQPRLEGAFSARQIDLDRLAALPEGTRRLPIMALRSIAETFTDTLRPSIPAQIGIGIDAATLAGATVQSIRADLKTEGGEWDVEKVEFRAPGFASVRASGKLNWSSQSASFSGPTSLEAMDPKTLVAWLEGRVNASVVPVGPLRASGDLTLASDRIAVEGLQAEVDRKAIAGRLVYAWASADKPPRLEADLNASELDVDGFITLVRTALPGATLDVPADVALSVDIGRATIAGVVANKAKGKLKFGTDGFAVERLSVADLAGAAFEASGRIEGPWSAPRGTLTLDVDARSLEGVTAVAEKFWPQSAETIRALAPRLSPAKLRMTLALDAAPQLSGFASAAKVQVDGTAGALRTALKAEAVGDLMARNAGDVRIEGRFDADDGATIVKFLELDRTLAVGKGAGSLRFTASGPATGELRLEGQLAANGFEATLEGITHLTGDDGLSARGDLAVKAADVAPLRQATGRMNSPVPLSLNALLVVEDQKLALESLSGKLASTTIVGRLGFKLERPLNIEAQLDADTIDGAALVAAFAGMPAQPAGRARMEAWPSEPFGPRLLSDLTGKLDLRASRATLTPSLDIRQLQALVRVGPNEVTIEDVKGVIAGGKLLAQVTLQSGFDGVTAATRIALTGADIKSALAGDGRAPVAGRFGVQLEMKGSGQDSFDPDGKSRRRGHDQPGRRRDRPARAASVRHRHACRRSRHAHRRPQSKRRRRERTGEWPVAHRAC